MINFPPHSVSIIIYLEMIHQSVHWSHMSYRRREETIEMEMSEGKDTAQKNAFPVQTCSNNSNVTQAD